jgi:hypothetical protein
MEEAPERERERERELGILNHVWGNEGGGGGHGSMVLFFFFFFKKKKSKPTSPHSRHHGKTAEGSQCRR